MTMPEGPPNQPGYQPPSGQPPSPGPVGYPYPQQPPAGPPSYYPQPGQPGYQAPPPKRGGHTGLIAFGVLLLIIAVLGGGFWLFRDRLSGGVGDLQVGDCIDEPSATETITDVQHQPCSDPHDGEVFLLITDPTSSDASYPATTHFLQLAGDQCIPAASTYLGESLSSRSELDIGYFYPTADSWGSGDRGITCYLYMVDGSKMTGSVRSSTASPAGG
jgi:Septum formation